MWARNLLFLLIVATGVSILAAGLALPVRTPRGRQLTNDSDLSAALDNSVAQFDRVLHETWAMAGVESSAQVDDLQWARRLALALVGAIPSLEEIRQLEAQPADRRRAWWVEHLLNDERSSDYLAERFARALVGVETGPFLVYRRRRFVNWLADQLAINRPYDAIVREMIASDGLWTDRPGTNFVTVAMRADAKQGLDAAQLATRTARVLLGVRLDCAQCHDHPFARWRQTDFEGLAAFYSEAQTSLVGLHDRPEAVIAGEMDATAEAVFEPRVPFAADLLPEEGDRRERLAVWITHAENEAFARATANRMWTILCGRPLVTPMDDLPVGVPADPALDELAQQFVASGFDLRHLIRTIALSEAYALPQASDGKTVEEKVLSEMPEVVWTEFPVIPLRPEQMAGAITQASSLETIDGESQFLKRLIKDIEQGEFVARYVDRGEQELEPAGSTISQRLLMMNGKLVREATAESLHRAPARIAQLAPDAKTALETAFLVVLTRRPTPAESAHFLAEWEGVTGDEFHARVEDLFWVLFNSTEFGWNH